MSSFPSARSEHGFPDGRRSAIYLPDGLAAKLLSVCDVTAGIESSEPGSPIDHDLEDLWSGILASSVDSHGVEEVIRSFVERYGPVPYLSGSDLNWFHEAETPETPPEDLYKALLEAAFGNPSGGTAFENEVQDTAPQTGVSFLNVSSLLHT